jgi:mannose-6-phosphate isomerase-like protein (cupin superfamily)
VILLQGKGAFDIGGQTQELEAVSFVHVPKGVAHHFKNTGGARMVTVHVYGPGLTAGDTVRVP